jgi:hypothetical protein
MKERAVVPPERVRGILGDLARHQERLRHDGATRPELEANRLSMAYWQSQLQRSEGRSARG